MAPSSYAPPVKVLVRSNLAPSVLDVQLLVIVWADEPRDPRTAIRIGPWSCPDLNLLFPDIPRGDRGDSILACCMAVMAGNETMPAFARRIDEPGPQSPPFAGHPILFALSSIVQDAMEGLGWH
jgi:hypothetical protein